MPRPLIPDNQSAEELEGYMLEMQQSLKVLQESAKDFILKQQIPNMKEYNRRRAVKQHLQADSLQEGDLVWVKNANLQHNKLEQQYAGPYFITKFLGEQRLNVQLSLDGQSHIVRHVEQLCCYHQHNRTSSIWGAQAESSAAVASRTPDPGIYPETPFTWSAAVPPEVCICLENGMARTAFSRAQGLLNTEITPKHRDAIWCPTMGIFIREPGSPPPTHSPPNPPTPGPVRPQSLAQLRREIRRGKRHP